jgi:hypothetical protein
MSFELVDAMIESDKYKGPVKAVLIALCRHISYERYINSRYADTEVWPGYETLARESGWSKKVVGRSIAKLESDGVVETISPGVGKDSAHYLIHLESFWMVPADNTSADSEVDNDQRYHSASVVPPNIDGGGIPGDTIGIPLQGITAGQGVRVYPERAPNK